VTVVCSFWLAFNSVFHHTAVLVLALGIGIGIGQYYWVLGASFGIVLTLVMSVNTTSARRWRVVLRRRHFYSAPCWSAAAGIWLAHRRSFPGGLQSRHSVRRSISVSLRWPLISFTRYRGDVPLLYNYVVAKATYIRLLHNKIGFLGVFSALAP